MLRSDVGRDFGFGLGAADPLVDAGFGLRGQSERELLLELELELEPDAEAGLEMTELGARVELDVERGREMVLRAGEEVRLCRDRLLRTGRGSSRSRRGTTILASSFVILIMEKTT
jgi:hypothetical protein